MADQLSFDLPQRTAMEREDFMVAPSNAVALAMLDQMATWALGKLVLSGPEGSGKTHLAHVWAAQQNARIVSAISLEDAQTQATGPLVVEDIPWIATDQTRLTQLFHLHNLMQEAGHPLLMTGRDAPNLWGLRLPDMQSRVDATTVVTLDPPDDTLLAAVLAKQFYDRQLRVKPDVIPYLLRRMPRSFADAGRIVEALDSASLREKTGITRNLAARVLDKAAPGAT